MKYVSTIGKCPPATFRDAIFSGLAPDGGLFVPEKLPSLPKPFLHDLPNRSLHDIGTEVCSLFVDDLSNDEIGEVVRGALSFPIPLVALEQNLYLLELFHGPTLAFKDVGARFLARILSSYLRIERRPMTILVATSGDTGSAVAHGFHQVEGIEVIVLYPSGKISRLQELQMTTLGGNICAVEVEGTFDDCQRMVREVLSDRELSSRRQLTTANSMNLGRL
ncbi:MAG TPA: pyridoxal-phosphate dependent enzyme, partial [Bacteroidota bacterium]